MLFEDMHWADPTSLELLTLTIEHLQKLPVLLVVTFRPEYQPPWTGQPHVTMLTLNRLSQRERATLVSHITGGKALPSNLLEQIVDRTDGVPLFVEELTKAVLESEQLQEAGDQYVLDQPARPLAIPTTLQASLMARVDRLGSAREVLQIGAAIGREFSYELVAAAAGLPDAVLLDALARLAEAELVFMRGTPPNATYVFKHALVQDSAYSAMLRSRRQQPAHVHRADPGEAFSGRHQSDTGSAGAAIRIGWPKRAGHRLLAPSRRARPAPLRHQGIDRALFQRTARGDGDAAVAATRRSGAWRSPGPGPCDNDGARTCGSRSRWRTIERP